MTANAFVQIAADVEALMSRFSAVDRDSEWHRVNSYVADVLKDSHVLYAKLARLQNDFAGAELSQLEKISEEVLSLGKSLSQFSKDFYDGKYSMTPSETQYGGQQQAPQQAPPPADYEVQAEVEGGDEDYEVQGQGQHGQGQGQGQQGQGDKEKQ